VKRRWIGEDLEEGHSDQMSTRFSPGNFYGRFELDVTKRLPLRDG